MVILELSYTCFAYTSYGHLIAVLHSLREYELEPVVNSNWGYEVCSSRSCCTQFVGMSHVQLGAFLYSKPSFGEYDISSCRSHLALILGMRAMVIY